MIHQDDPLYWRNKHYYISGHVLGKVLTLHTKQFITLRCRREAKKPKIKAFFYVQTNWGQFGRGAKTLLSDIFYFAKLHIRFLKVHFIEVSICLEYVQNIFIRTIEINQVIM